MSLHRFWLLLLCFCYAVTGMGQPAFFGNPFVKNYSTEDFKGGIQSWGIIQDNREVVYVANNFGLLEFDGAVWNLYPVNNGTKVRSVYASADKKVYVGSQADFGYFSPNATGNLEYTSLKDKIPLRHQNFDEVWRIYEIKGKIYFLTFKNIYIYQPGKPIQVIEPANPLELSFPLHDNLYTLEWNVGLSLVDGQKLRLLPGGEVFAQQRIASILPYDRNLILVFTAQNGIFLYDGSMVRPFSVAEGSGLNQLVINQAIMLKDGTFAIATQDNGLYLMNKKGELLLHLSRREGLFDNTIHTLYQDVHENLWLGLNNGISLVELSSPFSRVDGTKGISGAGYTALYFQDRLYLGTNSGLFASQPQSDRMDFSLVPNSTGQVYQLRNHKNKLLVGHHNGPYVVADHYASEMFAGQGAWDFVKIPGKPGYFILGSYNGISLLREVDGKMELIRKYKGFEESSRVLSFDREGTLWIAHGYKGIFRIRFDAAFEKIAAKRFYSTKDGLPSDQLLSLEHIRNELVFPALYGVYRYNPATDNFQRDEEISGYFHEEEHIIDLEEDIQGNIYFISDERVGKITFDKFGKPLIEDRLFNNIRSRLNDDLQYIRVLDLNNVLFGAKDGFIHFNAAKGKAMADFRTHLTKVINTSQESDSLLLSKRRIAEIEGLTLPYQFNSLRFVYSSSYYESPEKTEYQYYLEGFDKNWSEWTEKTEKEYTNLSEGRYVFHVKARNIYGTVSEAESFRFEVEPPFYRNRWAFAAYIMAGFFMLGTFFYQVDKRFKREKNQIILAQEQKLNQKETEARLATEMSEQEINRLRNEKQQSEIDHMNRELTSSTIHLINKNEVLSSVKQELQSMLKDGELNGHSDELKKIIRNIEQNITSDAHWNQFELHFNHVHGDFTKRLQEQYPDMTPQEIKLSTYLRLNLTTKEIAQLLSISVRGVEISRYRLRKRLGLDRSDNLTDFILRY